MARLNETTPSGSYPAFKTSVLMLHPFEITCTDCRFSYLSTTRLKQKTRHRDR